MNGNYVEGNLGRASFLRLKGYRLEQIVPIGHKLVGFSFCDHDGKARQTAEAFSNGASAPAEKLLGCFSDLKSLMYRRKILNEGKEAHEDRKQVRQTAHQ